MYVAAYFEIGHHRCDFVFFVNYDFGSFGNLGTQTL